MLVFLIFIPIWFLRIWLNPGASCDLSSGCSRQGIQAFQFSGRMTHLIGRIFHRQDGMTHQIGGIFHRHGGMTHQIGGIFTATVG